MLLLVHQSSWNWRTSGVRVVPVCGIYMKRQNIMCLLFVLCAHQTTSSTRTGSLIVLNVLLDSVSTCGSILCPLFAPLRSAFFWARQAPYRPGYCKFPRVLVQHFRKMSGYPKRQPLNSAHDHDTSRINKIVYNSSLGSWLRQYVRRTRHQYTHWCSLFIPKFRTTARTLWRQSTWNYSTSNQCETFFAVQYVVVNKYAAFLFGVTCDDNTTAVNHRLLPVDVLKTR